MKIKKLSLFLAAVTAVLCFGWLPASLGSVSAATSSATAAPAVTADCLVSGYDEYKADYIVDKITAANGLTLPEKDADDKEIKYYFDYAKNGSSNYSEPAEVSSAHVTFKEVPASKDGKVAMTLRVFTEKDGASEEKSYDYSCMKGKTLSFYVVSPENNANTISYNTDSAVINAYAEAVVNKAADKEHGANYYYPDFEVEVAGAKKSLINSLLYDVSDLKKTVYYAKSTSSSFTSTTSSYFKLADVGTYKFYVVFEDYAKNSAFVNLSATDDDGNALYERKVVGGIEGFYDGDNNLVVPVFSFTVSKGKAPEITLKKTNNGYFGLEYEVEAFTVVTEGNNSAKKYTLYFSKNDVSGGISDWNNVGDEILEELTVNNTVIDITDDEDYDFNSSDLTFTPSEVAGYYYVVCRVSDENGTTAKVCNPIAVKEGFSEVKRAFDVGAFFKNNYLSIIFLSIAVLSAIGIVLLIFIKPKEKVEEEVKPQAKN